MLVWPVPVGMKKSLPYENFAQISSELAIDVLLSTC